MPVTPVANVVRKASSSAIPKPPAAAVLIPTLGSDGHEGCSPPHFRMDLTHGVFLHDNGLCCKPGETCGPGTASGQPPLRLRRVIPQLGQEHRFAPVRRTIIRAGSRHSGTSSVVRGGRSTC